MVSVRSQETAKAFFEIGGGGLRSGRAEIFPFRVLNLNALLTKTDPKARRQKIFPAPKRQKLLRRSPYMLRLLVVIKRKIDTGVIMGIRVLIAEDNEDYRELVDLFLKMKGFEVILANDGMEAVQLAKAEKPHIILMDLNLPNLDGWEATKIIKQDILTSHIPIIVVSANCSGQNGDKALKMGADGCVQKPIDIESLPDLILSYAASENA